MEVVITHLSILTSVAALIHYSLALTHAQVAKLFGYIPNIMSSIFVCPSRQEKQLV